MTYIIMYLVAIIIANLDIVWFQNWAGTSTQARLVITSANAFLFIGLDLTARDALHDAWHGRGLLPKMAALIAAGSALSWLLNRDAGRIAVASFAAFALAASADTLVYALLGERARLLKVNGSNVVSAAVDSVVFPTLAFSALLPWVTLGQFAAKVGGGFVWSLLLMRAGRRPRPVAKGA